MSWLGSFFGTTEARPTTGVGNSAADVLTYLEELTNKVKQQFKPQPNEAAFWRKVGV
jgi:hypothetical protein